ncbi:hypothetical protein Taro_046341 [Colocasia esculenta]|uniref:Outer envelope pore protein 16, chloroplastic n=1 Tax=Colocasia esculenta TaxID=4460 RepID=A0A843WZ03_COLES|nr:hypothetical protein [Colocasia esculenta]
MPRSRFSGSLSWPRFDVVIDMGNPSLNRTIDGFVMIGTVAAARVAAEEAYHRINHLRKGTFPGHTLHDSLKKMCKEGAYWGTIAELYVGMEYGMRRIRGKSDWKNALLGGAVIGALISVVSKNKGEKVIEDAIKGGAVATAAKFLNCAY